MWRALQAMSGGRAGVEAAWVTFGDGERFALEGGDWVLASGRARTLRWSTQQVGLYPRKSIRAGGASQGTLPVPKGRAESRSQ